MHDESTSEFLMHTECSNCGSSDANSLYTDGHEYCFSCEHFKPGEGEEGSRPATRSARPADLIDVDVRALGKRKISEETCRRYGYGLAKFKGQTVQVATYRDADGNTVGQKLRFADKSNGFPWLGDGKKPPLFGQHLTVKSKKKLVVTEGEIDCLTMSQVQGNKWPVVSVPLGAGSAAKSFKQHLQWLSQFEEVVIMFDMDEPGREAAQECARILPPGKAKIATLPLKDPSEMLMAGRQAELIDAMWGAQPYRPDGIRAIEDFFDQASKPVVVGIPWVFPKLTDCTYGRRPGEVYGFGGATGGGKTSVFTQQMAFDVQTLGERVGAFYLETPPVELTRRVAGKLAGTTFHIPGEGGTPEQFWEAAEAMRGKVELYDHFGETDWDVVKSAMRHMIVAGGIKLIYLDHLTAMADPRDERASLEVIMEEMATLAQETGAIIHYISHLATPEGKPHEEGGRVMVRHFKGSRAIGFWSHFMFGIERDQQSVGEPTTFRVLKDRYTGRANGRVIQLIYEPETDRYREATQADLMSNDDLGFGGGGDDDIPF